MSEDEYTEITHQSWFSRIKESFKGILVGLILFLVAFPLLFWNEGRAVQRYKTLKEGSGAVVSVASDDVAAAHAGKLVHVTGVADTEATLTDPVFGISTNALKLWRVVEMYQWEEDTRTETDKKVGGGETTRKTYSYRKTWSDDVINSSGFKRSSGHRNPDSMPYESTQLMAEEVTLGDYALSESLVRKIQDYEPLAVKNQDELPAEIQSDIQLHDGGLYMGGNPQSPQVGDVRINFKVARPMEVSVVAKQVDNSFAPYATEAGGAIELLQTGVHSAQAMFEKERRDNRILTWILRLVGFVVMFFGLLMIFKPLSVVADVLPILGDMVGAGTGIFSFVLAATLSIITIAVAWFAYRPLLGITLVVVALGMAVASLVKLKSAKTAA